MLHIFQRYTLVLIFSVVAFVLGMTTRAYEYFPYPQARHLARAGIVFARQWFARPDQVLSRQYRFDKDEIPLGRNIETALLPLKLQGVRLSEHVPIPKAAGGIATIGNSVVVLDRLANLYLYDPEDGRVKKLPFPPIPNNVREYLRSALVQSDETQPAALTDYTFRAYDVVYMTRPRRLVVSHEYFDKELGKSRLAVSTIQLGEDSVAPAGSWKTIFLSDPLPRLPTTNGGGKLVASGTDAIYLALGDHYMPAAAQDKNSKFGKIVRINVSTGKFTVLSMGHRNPEGLALTSAGELLETEHGPKGGDELNLIVAGANYGWPRVTLGTDYSTYSYAARRDKDAVGEHKGFTPPLFAWVPSIGVSNLIQIRNFHRRWDGDMLVGSLKATSLFRLRFEKSRVLYAEQIWVGQRIRDVAQMEDGRIVLWTDDAELLLISVDRLGLERSRRLDLARDDPLLGSACMICHHFGPTHPTDPAPSLSNLFKRKIASDNFRYSVALRGKEGVWTEDNLRQFLSAPDVFATGTSMMNNNLHRSEIDAIVESLKAHKESP
jgi:cytochrome c2